MARYTNELDLRGDPSALFREAYGFLKTEGFSYVEYQGEAVFQKGSGFFTPPTFIKLTFTMTTVRVEAWIKNALLPGVFVGEYGMESVSTKSVMGRCVPVLERMLGTPRTVRYQGIVDGEPVTGAACPGCGGTVSQGSRYCGYCGSAIPVASTAPRPTCDMTKRGYRDASQHFRRDLRGLAIMAYFLLAINAVFALSRPMLFWDVGLYLVLVLGMHLGKSKLCAIGILLYSFGSTVFVLARSGVFSGWYWILIGIASVCSFASVDKEYKQAMERMPE